MTPAHKKPTPKVRVPDLFIVGAPKSGTTSLYEYLKGHPQVFMSAIKEPCYFSADLALDASGNFLRHGRDEKAYFELFAEAGDARRLGEASTRYLYSKDAAQLIREASPEARIVAMLRNPVDMIHSLHSHKLAAGTEDLADFEQALAAEGDRHAGRRIPAHSNPRLATYRDRARYGEQLQRWLGVFGRERVHVMLFEDMLRDPPGEFRRLLEFLDVDPDYQPDSFGAHNAAHAARSRTLRSVLNARLPQWLVWRLLPRLIGEARTRSLVQRFRDSRLNRQPMRRGALRPELRRQLEQEFAPDVALLSELLGRDFGTAWFKAQQSSATAVAKSAVIGH